MQFFESTFLTWDIAKDCLLTGQEQACTRITWLFVHLFDVTMPKMTEYTEKWLLNAPSSDHIPGRNPFEDQTRPG